MKTIIVNNPAARSSGALTILLEFLDKISTLKCKRQFICFVSLEELKKYESEKIKMVVIKQQGFKERILWDNYRLKKYLKDEKINSDFCISLQNTGVNLPKEIPQILYFHQGLSISEYQWKFFKKEERVLWLYRNIFPIFVKMYKNRLVKVIVQTNWMKNNFSKKFNYNKDNIVILKPIIKNIDIESIKLKSKEKYIIFYPATPYIYKNHKIIIESLGMLLKEDENLHKKVECIFTFEKGENRKLDNLIKKNKMENIIKLVGQLPRFKILEYYKNSNLLVYPSLIESFGLPLLEAQQFGLDIIAGDLSYCREVTENYKKIEYLQLKNNIWKNRIKDKVWEK